MNFVPRRPEKFSIKRNDEEILNYKEKVFNEIIALALKIVLKLFGAMRRMCNKILHGVIHAF